MLFSIHVRDNTLNLGDRSCSPLTYFNFGRETAAHHLLDYQWSVLNSDIILGGGGLLHFSDGMEWYAKHHKGKLVSWGIGQNTHGTNRMDWPKWLDLFDLHGIRDYENPYRWVPCVSCLSRQFDFPRSPTHEIVIYEHYTVPIGLSKDFPVLKNNHPDFKEVINFLASGSVVLTNTYHGAYWATLLGKRVITFPFANRFYGFKHPPLHAQPSTWKDRLKFAQAYPEALGECREANMQYSSLVSDVLKTELTLTECASG